MDKYELIYEKICDLYENDEITLEKAEKLNKYAYDKYVVESSDDEITLEEAMNTISEYLEATEAESKEIFKAGKKAINADLKKKAADDKKLYKNMKNSNIKYPRSVLKKSISKIGDHDKSYNAYARLQKKTSPDGQHTEFERRILKRGAKELDKDKNPALESVDALRLRVYDAFEEGTIDEETKTMFLDYLNLNNYK